MFSTMTPSLSKLVALSLFLGTALGEPWKAIDADFPDPSVIKTDDGYYAFATTANGVNTQIAHSADFKTWNVLDGQDALPGPFPSWVNGSHPKVWAPDVIQRNDGKFVIYYSAATSGTGSKHCIGAATSSSVTGPYSPEQDVLACDKSKGGAIDAAGFKDDDGTYYVVYKVDGNSLNEEGSGYHPTPIMLQKLKSDAVTPDGEAKQLIDRDDADGPLVEAPSLVKSGGQYYLSFSSNWYNSLNYDVSYAVASAVTGPYTKASAPDAPLLVSGDSSNVGALGGPGGSDFREDGNAIVFHAFNNGKNMAKGRGMWAANVKIDGGKISIQ